MKTFISIFGASIGGAFIGIVEAWLLCGVFAPITNGSTVGSWLVLLGILAVAYISGAAFGKLWTNFVLRVWRS